jgi:putative component of membrane protein insertase Oxa1/YidC/SpoIIIJ protein YidD
VISRITSTVIRLLIRFYQRILNPMLKVVAGPAIGCRYTPSWNFSDFPLSSMGWLRL